jgi:hypothetical protein
MSHSVWQSSTPEMGRGRDVEASQPQQIARE